MIQNVIKKKQVKVIQKINIFVYFTVLLFVINTVDGGVSDRNQTKPLQWYFKAFPLQPGTGMTASLVHDNNGILVALTPNGDTWEGCHEPGTPLVRNGGLLRWKKKTDLMRVSPEARISADMAVISWKTLSPMPFYGVVLFGGIPGVGKEEQPFGDTWLYQKSNIGDYWESVIVIDSPPSRYGHALANYGFNSNKVVLFGGCGQTSNSSNSSSSSSSSSSSNFIFGDTWILNAQSLMNFVQLSWYEANQNMGNRPSPRYLHAMSSFIITSGSSGTKQSSVVMFGGCEDYNCGSLLDDTWLFTLDTNNVAAWQKISTTNTPSSRRSHSMSFLGLYGGASAIQHQALLFGGACKNGIGTDTNKACNSKERNYKTNDKIRLTWTFYETSEAEYDWQHIPDNDDEPSARFGHSMATLSNGDTNEKNGYSVVLLGGKISNNQVSTAPTGKQTWIYTPIVNTQVTGHWKQITPNETPSNRAMYSMSIIPTNATNTIRNSIVLFGGSIDKMNSRCNNFLDGCTWEYNDDMNEWKLHIVNDDFTPISSNLLSSSPPQPLPRAFHQMTGLNYDGSVIMFGGFGGCEMRPTSSGSKITSAVDTNLKLMNDTWVYKKIKPGNSTWSDFTYRYPENKIILRPRQYHAMATLSLTHSIIAMFGGVAKVLDEDDDDDYEMLNDLYIFNMKIGWKKYTFNTSRADIQPSPRLSHSMAQLTEGVVLMFGGALGISGIRIFTKETWKLYYNVSNIDNNNDYPRWEKVVEGSYVWPCGRMDHAMTSMGKNKVLLFGGCVGDRFHSSCVEYLQDLWMFVLPHGEQGTWIPIESDIKPATRAKHSLSWLNGTIIMFGGQVNKIQGSVKEPVYGGDTWLLGDGCPKGLYQDNLIGGCHKCPIGKYNEKFTLSSCTECPNGLTTTSKGSTSSEECVCNIYDDEFHYGICSKQCSGSEDNNRICKPSWKCFEYGWGPGCKNLCNGTISVLSPDGSRIFRACSGKGYCFNTDGDKNFELSGKCNCDQNFAGVGCELDCGEHGDNGDNSVVSSCKCDDGWTGVYCNISCGNGKAILPSNKWNILNFSNMSYEMCQCTSDEYYGYQCDQKCDNHGKGIRGNTSSSDYRCDCVDSYFGPTCSDRCLNGGKPINGHSTICSCKTLYAGKLCETYILYYIIIFVFVLFILIILGIYKYWQRTIQGTIKQSNIRQALLQSEYQQDITMLSEGWRIDDNDLEWEIKIADGGFGEVWKGIWTMLPGRYVAIKKIKLLANDMNQFRAVNQQENTKTLPSKKSKLHRGSHTRGSKSEGDGSHFEKYFNSVDDNGYNNNGDDGMDASWVDQEIMLLMRTRHRRVVLFLGAGKIKLTGEIFLVSEYMDGGDLRNVITKSKNKITGESTMKWSHRYMIAYDIAEGMEFLHSRKLIHRDLKSFNVLIDRNGRAKIADFGLSRFTNIGKAARKSFATFNDSDNTIDPLDSMFAEMTGLQGSVLWMAPEIDSGNLHSKAKYGFSVDVYSYAIVLFELITTRLPWEEVQQFVCTRVAEKVKNGQRPTIFPNEIEIAKKYGNVLLELMYVCWSQNPLERPTFVNILSKLRTVDVIINVMKSDHERRASSSSNYAPPKYPTGLVPSRSLRRSADENDEIKDYNKQHKNNLRRKSFSFLPSTNDSINNHRHQHHRVLTSNIHGNNGSASRKIRSFNVEKNNENKINLVESSCDSSSSRTHVSGHTILSNPLPGHVV